MSLLEWYRYQIELCQEYILLPWGSALCLYRLKQRNDQMLTHGRRDIQTLFLLLAWIIVPFAIRFGLTFNNVGAWYNHMVVYFGIYAALRERTSAQRERSFDQFAMLCGALSLVFGAALMYAAAQALSLTIDDQGIPFGLFWDEYTNSWYLAHGVNPNFTGMICLCLAMVSMAGAARSRNWILRLLFVLGVGLMVVAVILTQSRTARYAMIGALAVGLFGYMMSRNWPSRLLQKGALAVVLCAAFVVAAFVGADGLTRAALDHYENVIRVQEEPADTAMQPEAAADSLTLSNDEATPKAAVDGTFSERTAIWQNLFKLWKANLKYLVIGNGIGRTGSRIVQGTIFEEAGAVQLHNTYLQHTADFGLIGTALLALFFALLVRPLLRVFFAVGDKRKPGYTALMMLVLAMLATGLMESAPLGGLSPANMMLFFALALLAGRGEDLAHL